MKNKLLYLWIFIILLTLHFLSCTPDQYVQLEFVPCQDTGYAVIRKIQIAYSHEFDTLACIRKYSLGDTTYWEPACIDNRQTVKQGDSKDTLLQTYPWPFVKFVKAKVKLERCKN